MNSMFLFWVMFLKGQWVCSFSLLLPSFPTPGNADLVGATLDRANEDEIQGCQGP